MQLASVSKLLTRSALAQNAGESRASPIPLMTTITTNTSKIAIARALFSPAPHLRPTTAIRPTLSAREFAFKIPLRLLRRAFWAARPKSQVLWCNASCLVFGE